MRHATLARALLLGGVVACGDATAPRADGYEDCTGGGVLAFFVTTRDAVTGAPMVEGATLTWHAGRSTGTEVPLPGRTLPDGTTIAPTGIPGPYGRPGVFDVVVRASGYRDARLAGLRVAPGDTRCSVRETVTREVRLVRP